MYEWQSVFHGLLKTVLVSNYFLNFERINAINCVVIFKYIKQIVYNENNYLKKKLVAQIIKT